MDRPNPTDADTAAAMAEQRGEPLLAAEIWLVSGSLLLGVALLGILLWISRTYFAA